MLNMYLCSPKPILLVSGLRMERIRKRVYILLHYYLKNRYKIYVSNIFWNRTNGRVLNEELYTHKTRQLIFLYIIYRSVLEQNNYNCSGE